MEFNFKVGQKLLVSLKNEELYEGIYIGGARNRIDLSDICEYPSGVTVGEMLSFYKTEIEDVNLVSTPTDNDMNTPQKPTKKNQSKNVIGLHRDEYERLKEMSVNYIYMATVDKRFLEATEHLKSCESVGVVGIGSECGRENPLSLLVMSSWDQVYVFDILSFQTSKFLPELKDILESSGIKKVVHNSRTLVDCLFHCHKVNLTNMFDIQVADLMLCSRERKPLQKPRNISECLQHYLNFPASLLEKPLKISTAKWKERPLKESRKIYSSLLATYLIILKVHLETLLLQNYYKAVEYYSNDLKNLTLFDASRNIDVIVTEELSNLLK